MALERTIRNAELRFPRFPPSRLIRRLPDKYQRGVKGLWWWAGIEQPLTKAAIRLHHLNRRGGGSNKASPNVTA